jgi:hypothetical protein
MDDDHPFLEKQMGHKPYGRVPRFGKNCNLVSIDCYSVWFGFVFGCVDKFDPVAGEEALGITIPQTLLVLADKAIE